MVLSMETSASSVVATKVPQVTLGFWAVTVLTTVIGETSSDFLVKTLEPRRRGSTRPRTPW